MSMLKPPRTAPRPKKEQGEGAEEAVSTAVVRARMFVENYRTLVIAAGVGIAVIFLATFGYFYWQHQRAQEANERLGQILPAYEAGDFETALAGENDVMGLEAIVDEYPRSAAGRLAAFYAGHVHFSLGQYDEADRYFQKYRGDDMILASALAGRAAVAEERGEHDRAARLYRDAARTYPSAALAPENLLSAARNYELVGDFDRARQAYEDIEELYPDSAVGQDVPIYLARLEALAQADAQP